MKNYSQIPRKISKPWGYEILFSHTDKYAGKILYVKKGHKLSLQYHQLKDESMYIQSGILILTVGSSPEKISTHRLQTGDSIHIPPMTTHRIEAIEDTMIFEVSTPELDDVVRLADDYGRI